MPTRMSFWDDGIEYRARYQSIKTMSYMVFDVQTGKGRMSVSLWQMPKDLQVDILSYCASLGTEELFVRHGIMVTY